MQVIFFSTGRDLGRVMQSKNMSQRNKILKMYTHFTHSYSYRHEFTHEFIVCVHADDVALEVVVVVAAALDCGRGEVGSGGGSGEAPVRDLGEVGGPARGPRETYR